MENKIEGKPKESRKGSIWYSFYLTFLCGGLMFMVYSAAIMLNANNPMDYLLCTGL